MSTDHAAKAREHILGWDTEGDWKGEVAAAQVHATLALVEQQRLANLIALARTEAEGGSTDRSTFDAIFENIEPGSFGLVYSVRPEIRKGLGL